MRRDIVFPRFGVYDPSRSAEPGCRQTRKPTRLVGSGWVPQYSNRKGYLLRFAYAHAHALLQQQQQGTEFAFGTIVMANLWAAASLAGLEQFRPIAVYLKHTSEEPLCQLPRLQLPHSPPHIKRTNTPRLTSSPNGPSKAMRSPSSPMRAA